MAGRGSQAAVAINNAAIRRFKSPSVSSNAEHYRSKRTTRHPQRAGRAGATTAPLFIISRRTGEGMDNRFSTHPNTENRIAKLEKLAERINGSRWQDLRCGT